MSTLENGKKLSKILVFSGWYDETIEAIVSFISQEINELNIKPFRKYEERANVENNAQKELGEEIALIYADFFSDSELEEIINFYSSPTGIHFAELKTEIRDQIFSARNRVLVKELERIRALKE